MPTPPEDDDLVSMLAAGTVEEAFSLLNRWPRRIDWDASTGRVDLADGGRLYFEKRRRSVRIERPDGGLYVIDLGRQDRMRSLAEIVTPDLTQQTGPTIGISMPKVAWETRGMAAIRDPLTPRHKRAVGSLPDGDHVASRHVDAGGRPRLVALGDLSRVSGFGTFLMDGGTGYASLRTTSGLGCFYDGPRTSFMKAVTKNSADQARAEGFSLVSTAAGPIGVVFYCGEPGDYLCLAAYEVDTGATIGCVVDLRRPPVKDGAIIDPPSD